MKLIFVLLLICIVVSCESRRLKRQFNFPDYDFFSGPRYPSQQGGGFQGDQGGFQGFPNQGGFNQGGFNQGGFNQGGFNQGNQGFPNQGNFNQGGNQNQGFPNQGNQGRPNQGNQNFPNQGNQGQQQNQGNQQRPTTQAPAVTQPPTTLSPQMESCRDACVARTTGQYNPVCGSDNQNYHNEARLDCARECGVGVTRRANGVCPTMAVTPQ